MLPDDELLLCLPPDQRATTKIVRPPVPDLRNILFRNNDDFRAGGWQRNYDIWLEMVQFLP